MNEAMTDGCHGAMAPAEPDLDVVAPDDNGNDLLKLDVETGYTGCSPTDMQLYAKRWVGRREPELSDREKRLLDIEVGDSEEEE